MYTYVFSCSAYFSANRTEFLFVRFFERYVIFFIFFFSASRNRDRFTQVYMSTIRYAHYLYSPLGVCTAFLATFLWRITFSLIEHTSHSLNSFSKASVARFSHVIYVFYITFYRSSGTVLFVLQAITSISSAFFSLIF